ncbi:DsbA family protein [Streptomyces sp. TRM49041]|uniref:DsbA family oxidoreductase n=1 Tax=Streptomyces sp. TRM49041 TaxID=2603216 RepID=UPI0011EFD070|nr:DsbA family protein [Streptomyces sp. TRM49041]
MRAGEGTHARRDLERHRLADRLLLTAAARPRGLPALANGVLPRRLRRGAVRPRSRVLVRLGVEAGPAEDEVRGVPADPDAYADDVRADEGEAAELGATGVPFFVLDRRYGVSGGRPAEVFTQALEQAWEGRVRQMAGGSAVAACDADGSCDT